jgi:hypothetical protein
MLVPARTRTLQATVQLCSPARFRFRIVSLAASRRLADAALAMLKEAFPEFGGFTCLIAVFAAFNDAVIRIRNTVSLTGMPKGGPARPWQAASARLGPEPGSPPGRCMVPALNRWRRVANREGRGGCKCSLQAFSQLLRHTRWAMMSSSTSVARGPSCEQAPCASVCDRLPRSIRDSRSMLRSLALYRLGLASLEELLVGLFICVSVCPF